MSAGSTASLRERMVSANASTNGTFVNGQNIAGQKNVFLTNNAKVSLGDEGFIYFVR